MKNKIDYFLKIINEKQCKDEDRIYLTQLYILKHNIKDSIVKADKFIQKVWLRLVYIYI